MKELTQEELDNFNKDMKALFEKHKVIVRAIPTFIPNEKHFEVDAQLLVQKNVEENKEALEDSK